MKAESPAASSYQAVLPSPLPGAPLLGLHIEAECVTAIDYLWYQTAPRRLPGQDALCNLLQRYFNREMVQAGSLLKPAGTPFQQRVWRRLQQIPAGEVVTYGELARELASSARAVAGACRANPIPILIPCHRVVAVAGLGGYMGETAGRALAIKQWLLQHEGYV